MLSDDEVTQIAYEEIFKGAESILEDWIDESGDYSEEDFDRIFARSFELLKELREKYVYASEEEGH
jgi:hypothetical protein